MEPHGDEAGAGAGTTAQDRNEPKYDDYIQFKTLPPGGPLNRWSHAVTREHDFPGAQVRPSCLPSAAASGLCRPPRPDASRSTPRSSSGSRDGLAATMAPKSSADRDRVGHAVRGRRPKRRHDEECAPGRHRVGLVGRESVQHPPYGTPPPFFWVPAI